MKLNDVQAEFFSDCARLYSIIERKLFSQISKGLNPNKLKNEFLIKYGITARQFNAINAYLKGKIKSIKALQKDYAKDLKVKIKHTKSIIYYLSKKKKKNPLKPFEKINCIKRSDYCISNKENQKIQNKILNQTK